MSTPAMPLVQVYAPDGTLGDIPYDKLHDALQSGAKMAVPVQAPDGGHGFVPADRVNDATKAGGKILGFTNPAPQQDPDAGFLSHVKNYFNLPKAPESISEGVTAAVKAGMPIAQVADNLANAVKEYGAARSRGHGAAYSADAAASTLVGVNPEQMEAAAEKGDTGGVLGEAAVPAAMAIAPELARGAGAGLEAVKPAIGDALRTPTGALKPAVKATASAIAATAGRVVPGGEIGGYLLGPKIADALIPDSPSAAYEMRARDLMRRGREQAALDRQAARDASAGAKAAPKPQITSVGPDAQAGEGRPATWDNDTVETLARWGDPDAIEQRRLRMLGGQGRAPLNFSTSDVTPKSVTRFGPNGEPIEGSSPSPIPSAPYTPSGAPDAFMRYLEAQKEPDVELVTEHAGPRNNASGEPGGGGLEEQGRQASGMKFYREMPGGQRVPITGLGAQDVKAGAGQRIIQVDANGRETVLDEKPFLQAKGRFRSPQQ